MGLIIQRGITIRQGEVLRGDRALRSVLPLSSFSSPMLRRGSNKPVQTLPPLQTHQCYPSLIYMYTHHTIYSYILTYTHINTNQSKPCLCSKHTGLLVFCVNSMVQKMNIFAKVKTNEVKTNFSNQSKPSLCCKHTSLQVLPPSHMVQRPSKN